VLLKKMSSPIHSRHQSSRAGSFAFVDAPIQTWRDEIARHAEKRKTVLQYCAGVSLNIVEEQKKTLLSQKNLKEGLHMKMVQPHSANLGVILEKPFYRLGHNGFLRDLVIE